MYQISRWMIIIFMSLCASLLASDIILVLKNRQLAGVAVQRVRSFEIEAGTTVPALVGVGTDENVIEVAYGQDHRDTLVLVFSPTCGICSRNWPQWTSVVTKVDMHRLRTVFVNLSERVKPEYLNRYHIEDQKVIANLDPSVFKQYHLGVTPQTLLIDNNGRVVKVWTGILRESTVQELVERYKGP